MEVQIIMACVIYHVHGRVQPARGSAALRKSGKMAGATVGSRSN
jgi:hypothetical protein